MRNIWSPGSLALIGSILVFPVMAHGAAYLKLGDIKGEATDHKHKDWINLLSVSQGVSRDSINFKVPPRFDNLHIRKRIDKSSPLLAKACASGTVVEELELEMIRDAQYANIPYLKYKLKDVLVTSYKADAEAENEMPMEEVGLYYTAIEFEYSELADDGTVLSRARAFYDIQLNAGGLAISPTISQLDSQFHGLGETVVLDLVIEDADTPLDLLAVEAESDNPDQVSHPEIQWTGKSYRMQFKTSALYAGSAVLTVRASDGDFDYWMSFLVQTDGINDPFDGFMKAYFTTEELNDPEIGSPIADPDKDDMDTLVEYMLGTNPREFTPAEEQLKATPRHIAIPGGNGEGLTRIDVEYQRRINDPLVRLILMGSPDGKDWTLLSDGNSQAGNPLYQESSTEGQNPLFEGAEGTVNPPTSPGGAYFLRLVAEMY